MRALLGFTIVVLAVGLFISSRPQVRPSDWIEQRTPDQWNASPLTSADRLGEFGVPMSDAFFPVCVDEDVPPSNGEAVHRVAEVLRPAQAPHTVIRLSYASQDQAALEKVRQRWADPQCLRVIGQFLSAGHGAGNSTVTFENDGKLNTIRTVRIKTSVYVFIVAGPEGDLNRMITSSLP